ncbi:hypothetical protein RSA46_03855 [Pseudomonas oryzihabitans]|nr:hypothetical protein SB5_12240 [Pseudomonas psychrotolerans]KTT46417.1 hypothetical protein RSA46_03855 [Pseudomonas psychrotolerans]
MTVNQATRTGIAYGLGATLLWGSYPLWYKPLGQLDAYHLLSWRIVFAELFLVALLVISGRLGKLRTTLPAISVKHVLTVAIVLGLWWLMYIHGIMTGRVLEVAFGYFLSPVMSMAVSRLLFKERLSGLQMLAISLAMIGVTLMAFELLSLRSFPWIAIVIGACYSFYGIFKKKVPGDPVVIQTLEIMALLPFALVFLTYASVRGLGHHFGQTLGTDFLLVATGLITVLPLWWYSLAAKQLSMVALSFLQFVPPICNFLLATFMYGEYFSLLKLMAFLFIWAALGVFTWNSIRAQRLATHHQGGVRLRPAKGFIRRR